MQYSTRPVVVQQIGETEELRLDDRGVSPVHLGALLGLVDVAVTVLGGGIRNRMSKKIINIYFFPMLTSKEFIRKCLNILNV